MIENVKQLKDTFDDSDHYNFDLQSEIYALAENINKVNTLSNKIDLDITYPWESSLDDKSTIVDLEKRDKWQSLFMPSGLTA